MQVTSFILFGVACVAAVGGGPINDDADPATIAFNNDADFATAILNGNNGTGNDSSAWERSGKFEGDIVLHSSQVTKNGVRDTALRWTNRRVYYTLSADFDNGERAVILSAILFYNALGCVRFVQRSTQANYVAIGKANEGCYSNVGMIGGAQELNLGTGCVSFGIVSHELLHALGFWHMQSNWNRDTYVDVFLENVIAGSLDNFAKYSTAVVNDYGVAYDYYSVMHFGKYAFSSNGHPTILPIPNNNVAIGQRVGPSPKDIRKLRKMYGCTFWG